MSENIEKKAKNLLDLGEFGLIEHLTKDFKTINKSTIYGVGDDAAVLSSGKRKIIITTDLLVEGIHFDMVYTPPKHLGYKSVVVNLSDIYAMNAIPEQITVSIAVSKKYSLKVLDDLYYGIKLACDNYKIDLVGGDTSSSITGMIISVTAVGYANENEIVYRNGAKINDLICVSGDLGGAYMGLQLLEREKSVFNVNPDTQPVLSGYDYILERQLKPEARKDIIELLKKLGIKPNSMIDISDGLSSELLHICKASEKGCYIYEEKIPIHKNTMKMAEEFNMYPGIAALNGGEDYELLITVPVSDYDKIKSLTEISIIGHITDLSEGKKIITPDGNQIDLKAQGWNAMQ